MPNDQEISVGVKISDDLIKSALSLYIAQSLGNSSEILSKIIASTLDYKIKEDYREVTYLQKLVRESIWPIAKEQWAIYMEENMDDIKKSINRVIRNNATRDKLISKMLGALETAIEKTMDYELKQKSY